MLSTLSGILAETNSTYGYQVKSSLLYFGIVSVKELSIYLFNLSHTLLYSVSYLLITTRSAISITPFL